MIRTGDREAIRRQSALVRRIADRQYIVVCPRCSWPYGRIFATESGAMTRLCEHAMAAHRLRLHLAGYVEAP